jgi:hypothetical protein
MADFTAAVRNTMLDWLVGNTTPAAVATRYITTFLGDPQGAGAENINTLTGSANRIDMTTAMAAAASGACTNDVAVTFTVSATGAATVDYVAVYSAITGGTLLASAQVTSKAVGIGDGLSIAIGDLDFAIT